LSPQRWRRKLQRTKTIREHSEASMQHPRHTSFTTPPERVSRLTVKERDVVAGLGHGRAPKQLARDLGVSTATIRARLQAAKRTTGARTLAELVAIAARADAAPTRRR
jgi:FixJ family two-component response regulator